MRSRALVGAAMAASMLLGTAPPSPAAGCRDADAQPKVVGAQRAQRALLCLVNRERAARGLPRLDGSGRLHRSADRYASQMVRQRFFAHVSPAGDRLADRLRAIGWRRGGGRWRGVEAIGTGVGKNARPSVIVSEWMRHARSRATLLSRVPFAGVGVVHGVPHTASSAESCGGATFVLHAGRPADAGRR